MIWIQEEKKHWSAYASLDEKDIEGVDAARSSEKETRGADAARSNGKDIEGADAARSSGEEAVDAYTIPKIVSRDTGATIKTRKIWTENAGPKYSQQGVGKGLQDREDAHDRGHPIARLHKPAEDC